MISLIRQAVNSGFFSTVMVLSIVFNPLAVSASQVHALLMHQATTATAGSQSIEHYGIAMLDSVDQSDLVCDMPCCDGSNCMQQNAQSCFFYHFSVFLPETGCVAYAYTVPHDHDGLDVVLQTREIRPATPPPKAL